MKILHTSDWHIGRALYGRKRYEEFERFLDWLLGCIAAEGVEALLVAGDLFDNGIPGTVYSTRLSIELLLNGPIERGSFMTLNSASSIEFIELIQPA